MIDTTLLLVAFCAFLLAGLIKGAAGLGLPTAAIAGITLFYDPRAAIALVLFPMLATNFWQWISAGEVLRAARQYAPFAAALFFFVLLTTHLTKDVPEQGLMLVLGVAILLFVGVSWSGKLPTLHPKYDRHAQIAFGTIAGVIGGMTSAWAAPLGVYLNMRQTEKTEFIRASGFIITIGSLPMFFAYARLGFLTGPLALMSFAMILPAMIGFTLGAIVRKRFSQEIFRNVVLMVFFLLALNLIRRALIA